MSINKIECNDFQIYTSTEWGAKVIDGRQNIRRFLYEKIKTKSSMSESNLSNLLDLKKTVTKIENTYISISHTGEEGACAMSSYPVGIDLELQSRLLEKTVERISSEEEIKRAPHFSFLWVAKEAAFKALYNFQQPSVISHIQVNSWEPFEMSQHQGDAYQCWKFQINSQNLYLAGTNKGILYKKGNKLIGAVQFFA